MGLTPTGRRGARLLLVGLVASLVLAVGWRTASEFAHRSAAVHASVSSSPLDHHRSAALPARAAHAVVAALQVRRGPSRISFAPTLLTGVTLTVLLAWALLESTRAASRQRRVVLAPLPSRAPPVRR